MSKLVDKWEKTGFLDDSANKELLAGVLEKTAIFILSRDVSSELCHLLLKTVRKFYKTQKQSLTEEAIFSSVELLYQELKPRYTFIQDVIADADLEEIAIDAAIEAVKKIELCNKNSM